MNISQSDHYTDQISLWDNAKPFRVLVYVTLSLFLLMVYGFYKHFQNTQNNPYALPSTTLPQGYSYGNANPTTTPSATASSFPTPTAPNAPQGLDSLPVALNMWSSQLNITKATPEKGFDAYYINTNQPTVILKRENVAKMSLNHSYDEVAGIPSQHFGAYWIGKISVPHDDLYELTGNASWSSYRAILNGKILAEGKDSNPKASIYLTKGDYTLEMEYTNNWHTTNFSADFSPFVPAYPQKQVRQVIASLNLPSNTKLYMANVYESANKDNSVTVNVTLGEPYVLFLSSYSGVNWQVYGTVPKAIIYSGNGKVTAQGSPKLIRSDFVVNYDALDTDIDADSVCQCIGGGLHCDMQQNSHLLSVINAMKDTTGLDLVGGAGKYSGDTLFIPTRFVTPETVAQSQALINRIQELEKSCTNQSAGGLMSKLYNN